MRSTYEIRINRTKRHQCNTLKNAFHGFHNTVENAISSYKPCKIRLIKKTGEKCRLMDIAILK